MSVERPTLTDALNTEVPGSMAMVHGMRLPTEGDGHERMGILVESSMKVRCVAQREQAYSCRFR